MTIRRTRILSIPFREPYYYSQGCALGVNSILVEVDTDESLTGVGEACGGRSAPAVAGVVQAAARCLVGHSPFDVEPFLHRFYRLGKWDDMRRFAHQGLAGVEMALWDLIGKACGQPLHRLLGGACRERNRVLRVPAGGRSRQARRRRTAVAPARVRGALRQGRARREA